MLLSLLLELLAPERCAGCDAPSRALFCPGCTPSVERAADPRAVFLYGGAVEAAIQRFKFHRRPDLARRLVVPLAEAALALPSVDVVVPVPLHPTRIVERGFDQAALLAGPVARKLGVRHRPRALVRVHPTPKQSKLSRAERQRNVARAFACPSDVTGLRVLLVDDVVTTGATLAACRSCLLRAGAAEVRALVLAVRDFSESPESAI